MKKLWVLIWFFVVFCFLSISQAEHKTFETYETFEELFLFDDGHGAKPSDQVSELTETPQEESPQEDSGKLTEFPVRLLSHDILLIYGEADIEETKKKIDTNKYKVKVNKERKALVIFIMSRSDMNIEEPNDPSIPLAQIFSSNVGNATVGILVYPKEGPFKDQLSILVLDSWVTNNLRVADIGNKWRGNKTEVLNGDFLLNVSDEKISGGVAEEVGFNFDLNTMETESTFDSDEINSAIRGLVMKLETHRVDPMFASLTLQIPPQKLYRISPERQDLKFFDEKNEGKVLEEIGVIFKTLAIYSKGPENELKAQGQMWIPAD